MIKKIIISTDKNKLLSLGDNLKQKLKGEVRYTYNKLDTLYYIKDKLVLLIADVYHSKFVDIELIQKTIQINPFLMIAVISNVSPKLFEEEFEGLGIIMQLTISPTKKEIESLFKKVERLY